MYKLAIKKSARKELDNLPDQIFLKVDKSILSLTDNPLGENKCRLRIGDYRVIYSIDEDKKTVTIYRVRHRKDVYR